MPVEHDRSLANNVSVPFHSLAINRNRYARGWKIHARGLGIGIEMGWDGKVHVKGSKTRTEVNTDES